MTANKLQWNNPVLLLAIFLIALIARLLSLLLDPVLQRDAALYLSLVERWQETGNYSLIISEGTVVPPLPLYFTMKLMECGLDAEIAGRSIALFLGAWIPVLGCCIAHIIFKDTLISGISALLFIFHPNLISYSTQPLRENYYLFFIGLTSIFAINGIKHGKLIDWGACGILLAFSLYSRYESLELLVFCPMILFYLYLRGRINCKKMISIAFVFFSTNIATSFLLLSITNYDISFVSRIPQYFGKVIQQNNVRDYIQINTQSNK